MRVTLVPKQPSEARIKQTLELTACDDCVGEAIQRGVSDSAVSVLIHHLHAERSGQLFNVFVPSVGTLQHWLHPECAEAFRND